MTQIWSAMANQPQMPFRRLFTPIRRPIPTDAGIVTAYTDGAVTLRSNRSKVGYHEATDLAGYQGVEVGDFVVHGLDIMRGSVGVSDSRGAMSSVCTIVTPGPLIDKYFAAYVIRVQAESGYPKALARGVREGGADFRRWETLAELPLPVPPLEHQRRVVAFLNYETAQINSLVEKQERLIETLAERRQAVISHAVTKGLDPTAQMKDSGVEWLGSVPESWVAAPIKWIASLTTGMTPASDDAANYSDEAEGFPWIRPEDLIESGITTTASRFVSALGWNISRIVPAGATLLCCIGATVGKVGIIDEACSTNQQITSLKSAGHDRYFFYAVLASKPELVSSATGNTMPILNSGRLGSIVLPVPPLAEQAAIAAHLDRETAQMDALAAKAREMIDVLKERRQALISAAVTGKIDVRGLS